MRKNRYFPFGYAMENGTVVLEIRESVAVAEIFTLYLAGGSYRSIAEKLTAGDVPYHPHTNRWNKHMVKRILEDNRYLGEKYPPLISPSEFERVQKKIASKAAKSSKTTKPYTRKAKTEFVCGECGKGLNISKLHQREVSCQNSHCILCEKAFTESDLLERIPLGDSTNRLTAELKIQQKSELSLANPCEDTLIAISEKLATLRFSEGQQKQAVSPEDFTWQDLLKTKRVIIYADTIQIV